jgi:hypothetical protein
MKLQAMDCKRCGRTLSISTKAMAIVRKNVTQISIDTLLDKVCVAARKASKKLSPKDVAEGMPGLDKLRVQSLCFDAGGKQWVVYFNF